MGRQGNFPRGIDIITEADYFSLAIRNNAYMRVSIFVGHYPEYFESFVDHLAEIKLFHSDMEIRKLTAATLALLTCVRPEYFISQIIPKLIDGVTSPNLFIRHGSVLGLSEILLGICGMGHLNCMIDSMKDSIF